MAYQNVLFEKRDQIAFITLNRPDKLNAYSRQTMGELREVWEDFRDDPGMRVAVFTGSGRGFCAGVDVTDKTLTGTVYSDTANYTARRLGVFKPVICAINGICAGGGLRFLIESDVPICSETAEFFDPHTSIGAPGEREMVGVSRRIGYYHALRMSLMGRYERMSARRAYELGLVTEVLPPDRLLPRAVELAETIKRNAPIAIQSTVELMWQSQNMELQAAVDAAFFAVRWNVRTEDFLEGRRAFSEKREPQWKGR